MISEELLRRAAARSCEHYAAGLAQDYDPAEAHAFSPEFEQRMARLCRRAEHPALYTGLRRVAAILLAALVTGTAWLSVDIRARNWLFGWLREIRQNEISYRADGIEGASEKEDFRPAWIPDGYVLSWESDTDAWISIGYKNEMGNQLRFACVFEPGTAITMMDTEGCTILPCFVAGHEGELVLSNDTSKGSNLVWADHEGRFFCVAGFLTEEELLKVASSIYEK